MPILPAEPDFYPPDLWGDFKAISRSREEAVWWCLHTKPRQEKATGRELRKLGLTFYLPQVLKEDRTPQGRKIRSVIPLFPGYLFLNGDHNDRLAALRGNRLVAVLEVSDQRSLECDLQQIHTMLSSGLPVEPEATIPVGSRVKIISGPLTGIEGTVIRRGKRDQFVAIVRFLGRGATVDLEAWQVEQVHES
jgi:transcription antitermination factor NusG